MIYLCIPAGVGTAHAALCVHTDRPTMKILLYPVHSNKTIFLYMFAGVGAANAALCLHADRPSELGALLPILA